MSEWQPIETAPHGEDVLLYCPDRGPANPERIELGCATHGWKNDVASTLSAHPWATRWMPLPDPPRRAKGQNRSVANFIETVLDEWLRDNPPKEPKK